MVPFTT